MNDTSTGTTEQLAALDDETLARELDWATAMNGLDTLRAHGEYAAADALALIDAQREAHSRKAERIQHALSAANAMNGVHERTITRLRGELEQARLTPGPTGLARVWSGYDDDECWFPMFADLTDAKAYAEQVFRASCEALGAGDPGEITWSERAARTDRTGYPDMWDLKSDVGGDGWVVCGLLVHPDLASGLREQPIPEPEERSEPAVQIEGQGALSIETATAPCPSCDGGGQETDADGTSQGECLRCCGTGTVEAGATVTVTHGGADHQVPYRPTTSLADLFASACDAFSLGERERRRLGLFNTGGVQLDTDRVLLHVAPGDLLVLRPRIVGA